jgi:hypothetical protein
MARWDAGRIGQRAKELADGVLYHHEVKPEEVLPHLFLSDAERSQKLSSTTRPLTFDSKFIASGTNDANETLFIRNVLLGVVSLTRY